VLSRANSAVTIFAEGFATGLALYQSIPLSSVIVAFDAGNLAVVAAQHKGKGLMVVAADNDHGTEARLGFNTGLLKGKAAAEILRCGVAAPFGILGTDWADYLQETGEAGRARVRLEVMRHARFVT
jgi:putative DNA primase/helicase